MIKVFECFAGIGAQQKAITNIKKDFKVIGTSEWDVRAIISYALIHNNSKFYKKLIEVEKWDDVKIDEYLKDKTFSLNSKNPSQITRKPKNFKINLIAANIVNNNSPDINTLSPQDVKGTNLLTYSFPCQGLSIANMGRGLGIDEKSNSTSNLIWQIKRLLDEMTKDTLPKYLLMENVTQLIGKNHIKDYEKWTNYLNTLNYTTYYMICKGNEYKGIQKRVRLFAISILNGNKTLSKVAKGKNNDITDYFKKLYSSELTLKECKKLYLGILNSSSKEEINLSIPNNTPSRIRMANKSIDLINDAEKRQYLFNTLTTKQDRHPNIGMINIPKKEGKLHKRLITPKEAYQIMGFELSDFNKLNIKYKEGILTNDTLYRQAGNSVVVSVLENVFKFIDNLEKEGNNEKD